MTELVSAYIVYQWDCPCGAVNHLEDQPPLLDECTDCGEEYEVEL